ncbi:hypothetical protein [Mesorhizobium loti]|uniref:hypothetical protein n=1 Tax=Rhizobium loti TaxID=381 RepID=UPI0011B738ED|nr:hypothetical protein [Mesorhizobium loti]
MFDKAGIRANERIFVLSGTNDIATFLAKFWSRETEGENVLTPQGSVLALHFLEFQWRWRLAF